MNLQNVPVNLQKNDLLSVVIPAFNEELVIEESITRIRQILDVSKITNEILVINDGSTDRTLQILLQLQKTTPLRIINLSSNSGHMNAIRAGLEASLGQFVLTIDADLQDPPEAIPEMFKIITSTKIVGLEARDVTYDIVQAYRADRSSDTFWKRKTASIYYRLIKKITGIDLIPHAADYRIMQRHVVSKLISLPEKNLVYRLLIPSLGFRIASFPIQRSERFAGESKYTNRKMISLAVDSIIGFTTRPLRFLAFAGFAAAFLLLIGSILTLLLYFYGDTLPGWPSLVLLILSFNAFLFAGLGLVGEYVGRIYQLVQGRPLTPWSEL
jgi:glycosyltransferase involved in cell wall biosynthesis